MRTLVVFCLVLFGWVQAAPQFPHVQVSALGAASASAEVSSAASDVLQRASSLGSVLSQVGADLSSSSSSSSNVASQQSSSASSSFSSSSSSSSTLEKSSAASSAIPSSSTLLSNTAFGKSSADSSASSSASSPSSSFSADAALEKSRAESSAASSASSSSSSHVAEATLEKSSLESASASLTSSSAQSSSVASPGSSAASDIHHAAGDVDSGKSEAFGVSSAASDIHHAAGVVDSGKSEASGVSSAASSVGSAGSVGAAAKPEVGVDSVKAEHANVAAAPPPPPPTSGLTVEATGSSSDADIPLKKVPVYVPVEYSASYQPENFFNPYSSARYNPYVSNPYGAFRSPGMPWYQLVSPEVPILTLYSGESHGANVEQREAWSPWTPVPYAKVGLACSHPESRWGYAPASGLVAASPLPYSPEALPTYRLHLPAPAMTPFVLGKTSTPWSHVIPAEVAKAAEPWNPYGPVQKLYIPDSFTSPAHAELVKTSSGEVSPWIPLSGFVDQAKSAWSPNNVGAPVFGIENAHLSSPWASNAHPNVGQARVSVPWSPASSASGVDLSRASFSIEAPWAPFKTSAYPVPSSFDLTTGPFVAPAWIEKSAPVTVEPPWIPLEPSSSPKEVRKSSAYNSMFWNPVLEETLKQQRAFSYPGSEYSYLPRYFLRSVGRRQ